LFKISEDAWNQLIEQQWFPFVALKASTIRSMANFAKEGKDVGTLTDRIASEFADLLLERRTVGWRTV
jgi:hypothetical protein